MNQQTHKTLISPWLHLARIAWVILAVSMMALYTAAIPYRFAQLQNVSPQAVTAVGELLPEEAAWLYEMGLSPRFQAVYFTTLEVLSALPFLLVGWLIFLRKSDTAVGLIISITGILSGTLIAPVTNALLAYLPYLELPLLLLRHLSVLGLVTLFFIFPDGRFVPRWTFLALGAWAILLTASIFIPQLRIPVGIASLRNSDVPSLIVFLAAFSFSMAAQFYRYRYVSSPMQKQQTKWVVLGLAVIVVFMVATITPSIIFPVLRQPGIPALQNRFIAVTLILIFVIPILPITVAISMLRYRLWDIDLVIRRTLIYSTLTLLLGLFYLITITLLQSVFSSLSNQQSPIGIVLSTLGIAALFTPLRKRIQDFIDRRFFRQKYDAEKALAEFAAVARSETNLEILSAKLVNVIQETLQPEKVSLWQTPTKRARPRE
jgi:hypothetical protein